MKITVAYDNLTFEFEAETKEDVYNAEKIIKSSIFSFGSKELNKTNNMIKGKEDIKAPANLTKPVAATDKQKGWLRAHGVQFEEDLDRDTASALIEANGGGTYQPKRRVE